MSEKTWKVEIRRQNPDVAGNLKVDLADHEYASRRKAESGLKEIWDGNELILGPRSLQLTVTKPVTKSAPNAAYVSAAKVLGHRFTELRYEMSEKDIKQVESFFTTNSEKECHEARLHVRVIYTDRPSEEEISDKFVDSNRYDMKIDKIYPSRLDGPGFVRLLTVYLPSYKMPQKPADQLK